MSEFNKDFWSERYDKGLLGWDAGMVTTPIKDYVDQLDERHLKILIPGCGQGHEAQYLYDSGYADVTVIDLVDTPLKNLAKTCPNWRNEQFVVGDFFDHDDTYDLILEQTFFCALDPGLRQAYANKIYDLLNPGGRLVGLLFDFPLEKNGPPFGGDMTEYLEYFKNFEIKVMSRAYNSIKPRIGTELFINIEKPV